MAPEYKLVYFNARGRAEHIRFIFAYAGVDYVDERIEKEQWPEYKKTMPFGMVPALELADGRIIGQSNAIARYLARKLNLAGNNEEDSLECDVLVDTLADLKQALLQYRTGSGREESKTILMRDTIPFYLNQFEKRINENGGYSVGNQVTWADFAFAASLESFEAIFGKEPLNKYPALRALRDKVSELPGIKEWLEKRPNTEF